MSAPIRFHCDVCGRFIALQDLVIGVATRKLDTPDSELSDESYETLCGRHSQKKFSAADQQ